jgi:hypothetical protein
MQRLTGIFDIRPYGPDHSIQRLVDQSAVEPIKKPAVGHFAAGLDLRQLQIALEELDIEETRQRKKQLNRIYHECLLLEAAQGGVSFTAMLLILAQHRLIDPDKALKYVQVLTMIYYRTDQEYVGIST